ncbi:MAG: hypothetical protein JWO19_2295 [Bryobacterales bacterium]|jgi:hypothetical protein|nr:hypothetical protein [Bryobacterales bacterium]
MMRLANGFADPDVSAAAAQIATHALLDLLLSKFDRAGGHFPCDGARHTAIEFVHHSHRRTDLTRCAVAALKSILRNERFLKWAKRSIPGKTLYRGNFAAFVLNREREAGEDAFTVYKNGAGTASALIAALLRAREMKPLAQSIQEANARFDYDLVTGAIDDESYWCTVLLPGCRYSFRRLFDIGVLVCHGSSIVLPAGSAVKLFRRSFAGSETRPQAGLHEYVDPTWSGTVSSPIQLSGSTSADASLHFVRLPSLLPCGIRRNTAVKYRKKNYNNERR